mmetsp:Transcript_22663/g.37448  ORF Transcript_22663/g.37448 Transcript_22663/m.37448 type:complete len:459 (-) Transcript_22663:191-1567(-)
MALRDIACLPDELVQAVLFQLDLDALRDARLTSKRFCGAVSSVLKNLCWLAKPSSLVFHPADLTVSTAILVASAMPQLQTFDVIHGSLLQRSLDRDVPNRANQTEISHLEVLLPHLVVGPGKTEHFELEKLRTATKLQFVNLSSAAATLLAELLPRNQKLAAVHMSSSLSSTLMAGTLVHFDLIRWRSSSRQFRPDYALNDAATILAAGFFRAGAAPFLEEVVLAGCASTSEASNQDGSVMHALCPQMKAMSDAGACAIARAIAYFGVPQLRVLNLIGNLLSDAACKVLGEVLSDPSCTPQLEDVRLNFNPRIGPTGGEAMVHMLRSRSAACHPLLFFCEVPLARLALERSEPNCPPNHAKPAITKLDLHDRGLGDAGLLCLADALLYKGAGNGYLKLEEIFLYYNNVSSTAASALAAALGSGGCPQLRAMHFDEDVELCARRKLEEIGLQIGCRMYF